MNISPKTRLLMGFNPTGDLGPFTIYTSRTAGTVWFIKAPPKCGPTLPQIQQRNRFRVAGYAWSALTQEKRNAWNTAARRARLYLTGCNLFFYWQLRRDRPALTTIERQSGINLLPP